MANPFYNHNDGVPVALTRGSSAILRSEFDAIGTGFDSVYTQILALAAAVGIAVTVAEVPVASSATTDIGNGYGPVVSVTGSNAITSLGAHYNGPIFLRFTGTPLLTNSASLLLPGNANITVIAGDACIAIPIGAPASGWRLAAYCRMASPLLEDDAVRKSATYADPTWFTALAWAKLTGVPTTIAGFGITDAPTKTGGGASGSWSITAAVATTAAAVTNGGALNTPASGNLANCTFPTLNQNTSGTAANATLAVNCTNAIGYSQTWQDMTGSRSSGVSYTNSSGKPIMVSVSGTEAGGGVSHMTLIAIVGSTTLPPVTSYNDTSHTDNPVISFIVPPGAAYSVTASQTGSGSSPAIAYWAELR